MQQKFLPSILKPLAASSLLLAVASSIACQSPGDFSGSEPTTESEPAAALVGDKTSLNLARVNEPAPDFTGVDSNGVSHTLSDYKGKVVVLEWTNHECPFVGKHYSSGNMQDLQAEATAKDVVWLSIVSSAPGQQGHVDGPEANAQTTRRDASPTAVILDPDGTIGRSYGARTTPHMYVIDSEGTLRYAGGIDNIPSADPADIASAENYVRPAIASLLSGESVEVATSQPYGCSVKYGS